MTLNEITTDLINTANDLGLEGTSVLVLIRLLAKAIYDNELCTTNLVLESSLSRSKNLNSRITAASDLGYSVFRGSNQRFKLKGLKYILKDPKIVHKFDTLVKIGKYSLVYDADYEFESGGRSYDIGCILTESVSTSKHTITESGNKLMVYFPISDVSNDIIVKVNGEIKSHQEGLFYGKSGDEDYLVDDKDLCVLTMSDYGVIIVNRNFNNSNAFKESDIVELEYLKYSTNEIDISSIKSISGFSFDNSTISYEVIDQELRDESVDSIYYKALTNFRNGYTIKADDDLKSIIETYFAKYMTGCNIKKYYVTNNYTTLLLSPAKVDSIVNTVEEGTLVIEDNQLINNSTQTIAKLVDNNYVISDNSLGDDLCRFTGEFELSLGNNSITIDSNEYYGLSDIMDNLIIKSNIDPLNPDEPSVLGKYYYSESDHKYYKGNSTGAYILIAGTPYKAGTNYDENVYYFDPKLRDSYSIYKWSSELSLFEPINNINIELNNGSNSTWKFSILFNSNNLKLLLSDVDTDENNIILSTNISISFKYNYIKLYTQSSNQSVSDLSNSEVTGLITASVYNMADINKIPYIMKDNHGDVINPIITQSEYIYKIASDLPVFKNLYNLSINYVVGNEVYSFDRVDESEGTSTPTYTKEINGVTYYAELTLDRSQNTERSDSEYTYYKLELRVPLDSDSNVLLNVGRIIINYVDNSEVTVGYYDKDGNILDNHILYYNCDEGKFGKYYYDPEDAGKEVKFVEYPSAKFDELENKFTKGYITLPRYQYEKLWIIAIDGLVAESSLDKYSGIYKVGSDAYGNEFLYGPGNILHIDTYYSNETDILIPNSTDDENINTSLTDISAYDNIISEFKSMIKTVYYVDNTTFNFVYAENLIKLPIKDSTDLEEFTDGYPLNIVVNYSHNYSVSAIRSVISTLAMNYKYKIGEEFNLYKLVADIQSIDGVKYVTLGDIRVSPSIELESNQYLLIDLSKIEYNPINDITRNIRYA